MDSAADSAVAPSSGETTKRGVTLRCWGTRGSIPSPGPSTAHYGGNTSCLEVQVDGHRYIFDAGSGLRLLGEDLIRGGGPFRAKIFLTHFHWDHIQGFPFFVPLYHPGAELHVVGPMQRNIDIKSLFAGQMGPIYFPIPFSAVAATMSFDHLNEGSWTDDTVVVSAMRVRHPSFTVGYRVEAHGKKVCYIPDNELELGEYEVTEGWRDRLVEFIGGADVLLHDTMYTEDEYPNRVGWGHSTFRQSIALAAEAGVKKLLFIHHAPERTDEQLAKLVDWARGVAREEGHTVEVDAASEEEGHVEV